MTGDPVPVAQPVGVDAVLLRSAFTVSETGVLAHRLAGAQRRQLVWADRTGRVTSALGVLDDTGLANPSISPDGRVAASRNPQNNADVWIFDARGVRAASRSIRQWTASRSGRRTVARFTSDRRGTGSTSLFQKPADMTTDEQVLLKTDQSKSTQDVSRDGRFLLYTTINPASGSDIWALPLRVTPSRFPSRSRASTSFKRSFRPTAAGSRTSPMSRARTTCTSARSPARAGSARFRRAAGWRPDGDVMAASCFTSRRIDASWRCPCTPRPMGARRIPTRRTRYLPRGLEPVRTSRPPASTRARIGVGPDGRFLMNIAAEQPAAPPIVVVLNWPAGLGKK